MFNNFTDILNVNVCFLCVRTAWHLSPSSTSLLSTFLKAIEILSVCQLLITIQFFQTWYFSVGDFLRFTKNLEFTCCSMLTLNIIAMELKPHGHIEHSELLNSWLHMFGNLMVIIGGSSCQGCRENQLSYFKATPHILLFFKINYTFKGKTIFDNSFPF